MPGHEEETAIFADAYIDALLARPRSMPIDALEIPDATQRRAADVLSGLPRFHPSFAFEETLAARLRALTGSSGVRLADVIPFPGPVRGDVAAPLDVRIDRRLLVGGAIASGVSVAALYAWWQAGRPGLRGRQEVVA